MPLEASGEGRNVENMHALEDRLEELTTSDDL